MIRSILYKILCTVLAFIATFSASLDAVAINETDYNSKLISGIGISGNYPYVDQKIRRYLTIRPGDPFNEETMNEQLMRIKKFYDREGWFDTEVYYRLEYVEEYDSVNVHIKIDRGFLLRYRKIDVIGNYSLPKSLVASKINTWKPYKPRRLRESIREIERTYRNEGFPLVRVRLVDKDLDLGNHRIDITLRINEGPYVTVHFNGNKHLGGKVLLENITVFREGAIDTFELEESVKTLKERYKERGFPNAEIDFNRKEISEKRIKIIFNIDEGKPERIRNIYFEGNEDISGNKIEDAMLSKPLSLIHRGIYDRKVLKNDVKRISFFYKSKGFLEEITGQPTIEEIENGTQLNIIIPVMEGPQTILESINFLGDIHFSKKKLLNQLKAEEKEPLDATKLDEEKAALVRYYSDNGYPYVKVNFKIIRNSPTEADLNFNIDSGPLVRFGDITITGDFLTSQKAITKAMEVKEGDPFSYEKLAKSKINLRRLGAFAAANIDPAGLEEEETVIPLHVRIEELRPFKLDFDVGYSTDEGLIAGIDFMNRNSFGWAKRTFFRLIGGRKFSRGEIGWIDPRLSGTDLELSTSGWLQYEDEDVYSYVQGGMGVGIFRRFHRTSFLVKTNLTKNYLLEGDQAIAADDSLRNNTIIATSLSLSFDTRNSFAYPTKGIFARGYIDFFDEIRGKDAHFVRFGMNNGIYLGFLNRFVLANELRFDNIQAWEKNTSIPKNELLFLGGDNSLRGFARNSLGPVNANGVPTGGRLRFINSTELRIGLFGNFKWIFFNDMGFLTNSYSAVSLGQLRHSAGFGLNYITPIGPISAVYGFVLDRRPGEDRGRFHLQFGYAF